MNSKYIFKLNYNKNFSINSEKKKCLCGGQKEKILFKFDRYEHYCPTILCLDCGLIRSNPRINENYMKNFYKSDNYRHFTAESIFDEFAFLYKTSGHILGILEQHINKTSKILEIGCGGGWNLLPFKKKGHEVFGTEYSKLLKKISKNKGVKILNSDLENLNVKFDVIIISHVLEHLYDLNSFFKNLNKIINKNCIIYIEVPSIEKKYSLDQIQFFHNYYFTKNTLMRYCSEHRFKIFKFGTALKIHQYVILSKHRGFINTYNTKEEINKILELKKLYLRNFYRQYLFVFYLKKIINKILGIYMTKYLKKIIFHNRTSHP